MKTIFTIAITALGAAMIASPAGAQITVVDNNNAMTLAQALLGCGSLTLNSASLSGHSNGACSSTGLFTAGINNYELLGTGIVLSTGCAKDYGSGLNTLPGFTTNFGVPATPAQEALMDPINGGPYNHFDVTTLSIDFTLPAGVTAITFEAVFGSDGFMEQVGTQFIDGFGLYVNGVNIAFNGMGPMSIDNPPAVNVAETELDGVLQLPQTGLPPHLFGIGTPNINPGLNNVTLVIGDASDGNFDTTVYIKLKAVFICPPVGTTSRLYTITGISTGVGWSWCIDSPDFSPDVCDPSVPPVTPGGTALDLATAFANSINSRSCGSNRLLAAAGAGAAGSANLLVNVGDVAPFNDWNLCVGAPCAAPTCCPNAFVVQTCQFNPLMAEVALSGQDCNGNGEDDTIDIAFGVSADVNQDGVPDACLCPADVDPVGGDGQVNINDLFAVLAAWGPCPQPCPPTCNADTDGDCQVDIDDLFVVIAAWGPCP